MPDTPLVQVVIGNAVVAGATCVEVEQVGYFAADRFAVTLAMGAAPLGDAAFYAGLGLQTIAISVAAAAGFVTLITGQIDHCRIDLGGRTATLCGRDLSARLIDTEIAETFANQTASQVATAIAARHGLTANVTATSVKVGQYYELDHARSGLGLHSRTGTEWNMLTRLALAENFALSVTGTVLNFGPAPAPGTVAMAKRDFMTLAVEVAAAIPVCATVKSWNTRNKAAVMQMAGGGTGNAVTLIRPNLSTAQAASMAANHLSVLSRHGTRLIGTLPGETNLAPGGQIALSGTDSVLDQVFVVDTVARTIDGRRGFVETVEAHKLGG